MPSAPDAGSRIRDTWNRTRDLPGGRHLFSVLLGRMVPYTGSIHPRVEELRDGYARVSMKDRRKLRNHLHSLHAVAVMNLAEVTSGLALNYGLPAESRSILTGLTIDYLRKARGTLTAEARVDLPETAERREYELETIVRDRGGEEVARARARWLVGPRD